MDRTALNRRHFLRSCGVAISLPFFPSLLHGASPSEARAVDAKAAQEPRRLLFCCTPLGFVPNPWIFELRTSGDMCTSFHVAKDDGWFPKEDGPAYTMPAAHTELVRFREHISFIKGLSHPRYRDNTHYGDNVFLTGADTFGNPSRSWSNTISCDQVAAASPVLAPAAVRHPYLSIGIDPTLGTMSGGLSWTEEGIPIVPTRLPAALFDTLFGTDEMPLAARLERLRSQRSILDCSLAQINALNARLNAADRAKLHEALDAVRDAETGLLAEERWMRTPKPATTLTRSAIDAYHVRTSIRAHCTAMFDLIHAAFLTDSTRVVTYEMPSATADITTRADKHGLNHAGSDAELVQAHHDLDRHMSKQIAYLLDKLSGSTSHDGQTLLHHVAGVFGSGVWGPIHGTRSLPIMTFGGCGGALKQGACIRYPTNTPLSNLWLTMLRAAGVAIDRFADSTGIIPELAGGTP